MSASPQPARSRFQVTPWVHAVGGMIERHRALVHRLAEAETRVLSDHLSRVEVREPIFIAGLARAGTTILLGILAQHPEVVTHQYRDYPFVHFPY